MSASRNSAGGIHAIPMSQHNPGYDAKRRKPADQPHGNGRDTRMAAAAKQLHLPLAQALFSVSRNKEE